MPTSIPSFNTSIVLGNFVDPNAIELIKKIQACREATETAQQKMNSLVSMKRSAAMTVNELAGLGVDTSSLEQKIEKLDTEISTAAVDYLAITISNESTIQSLQCDLIDSSTGSGVGIDYASHESPIDFSTSKLVQLPLSSESIKLDSQFFSFGMNNQSETLANIESFVRSSASDLGTHSNTLSKAASQQVKSQLQNHSISGTLIIAASCTHRNVSMFDPCVIDPDKAVSAWNSLQPDKIDINNLTSAPAAAESTSKDQSSGLHVITGASYGSAFFGIIHILKSDSMQSGDDFDDIKARIENRLRFGGWLQNATGGFGVDESATRELQGFLNTQEVSVHVGMIVLGAVPTLRSNGLKLGVKELAGFDSDLASAIESEACRNSGLVETMSSESACAVKGRRLLEIQNATTSNLLKTLENIDHGENKAIDINSIMNAFENYVETVQSTQTIVGVPLQAHIKTITKNDVVTLWMNKYRNT